MTPTEVYNLTPISIETNLVPFFQHDWIFPELGFPSVPNPNSLSNFQTQTEVEIRIYRQLVLRKGSTQERKIWKLAGLFYQDQPAATLLNVSDESVRPRFITDTAQFEAMIKYLFQQIVPEESGFTNPVEILFAEQFAGETLFAPLLKTESPFTPEEYAQSVSLFLGYH